MNAFNPDISGPVRVDGVTWRNAINFIYATLVECSNPVTLSKFCSMSVEDLRISTKEAVDSESQIVVSAALKEALRVKFNDADLAKTLIKTGTVKLRSMPVMHNSGITGIEDAVELMKCRKELLKKDLEKNAKRDLQAYIKRVKQAVRISKAMTRMLYLGNNLEKFRHFSIASIPQELCHSCETSKTIDNVDQSLKSAALSLNGNVIYYFVRKKELRNYKNGIDSLRGNVAKECLSDFILDTRYPYFYKESVAKNTGGLKSEVNSLRLSLENTGLGQRGKRDRIDALERAQNKLKYEKSKLTKPRVYRKHAELLRSIPDVDKKVWGLFEKKLLPHEVQHNIEKRLMKIYNPTDLEIEQAEAWTHRPQVYYNSTTTSVYDNSEVGEYVVSKSDFPELTVEYEVRLVINDKSFASVAHYVLYSLLCFMYKKRPGASVESIDHEADHKLRSVTGQFVGCDEAVRIIHMERDKTFELLMREGCNKALSSWIEQDANVREKLRAHREEIYYKSPNPVLGVGISHNGQNLVGKTLMRLRNVCG
jgi:predicted NAD-dependent protein-ADP-ribosyltransferase YbiA (DUF1768 family)